MVDVQPDLTQDEWTCLQIAAEGGSLAAIGRWEEPVKRLIGLGLRRAESLHNHVITEAGRQHFAAHGDDDLRDFLRALGAARKDAAARVIEGEIVGDA